MGMMVNGLRASVCVSSWVGHHMDDSQSLLCAMAQECVAHKAELFYHQSMVPYQHES